MNGCAATADLNRYLAKMEEEDRRSDRIERRLVEKLSPVGDCWPLSVSAIAEAVGESNNKGVGNE